MSNRKNRSNTSSPAELASDPSDEEIPPVVVGDESAAPEAAFSAPTAPVVPEEEAPVPAAKPYPPQAGSARADLDGPAIAVTSTGTPPPAGQAVVFDQEDVRKAVQETAKKVTEQIAQLLDAKALEFRSAAKGGRADMTILAILATEFTLFAARVRSASATIELHHVLSGVDN